MRRHYRFHKALAVVAAVNLSLAVMPVSAELKSGDKLDQSNCQEAKGMLPEHVMEKFCDGKYIAEVIEVKEEAFQYSKKFREGSEANADKYYVNEQGYLYETASKSWPHYWYGFPFPSIDEKDQWAAHKVMYNHQVARYQVDDVYWFTSIKWVTPSGFDRNVDVGAYGTWFIGRHSGPIDNPDDVYLKDLIFGVAPYDVVGVSTLEWWHTDPATWQSVWAFVPTIRRVRRLTASNTSEGLFGSIMARDDGYGGWSGKIQYQNWKLIGVQDMLVPIAPGGVEKAMLPGEPSPKKLSFDTSLIKARGELPPGQVARITWPTEEQVRYGYETEGWTGVAWAPSNLKLAKRKCWVVEGIPKDPYYAAGRRVVYIDKTAYWGYWGTIYDRGGEYWKTLIWMDKMAYTPGRDMTTRHPFWGLGEDVRQNRATYLDLHSRGTFTEYESGFPNSTYTTTNLSAMGK